MIELGGLRETKEKVMTIVREAHAEGQSVSLNNLTARFVKEEGTPAKASLYDAVRQLGISGKIVREIKGTDVILSLP